MSLTIVIPTHNEEGIIVKTLESIRNVVKVPHKIIVIDDSNDTTQKLVKIYSQKHKNVSIFHGKPNTISFSNALKLGFKTSKTDFVVVVMADLCDDPRTINQMYKKIEEGWDVVCGSRYMKGGEKIGGPKLQNFMSRFVCISLHLLTGIPTLDVSNAFKMYRRNVVLKARTNPQSRVESSMETLLQLYFKGNRITELPTKWKGRIVGKSKFKILERTPRYLRIYIWALENSLRRSLKLPLKKFYV